MGVNKVLTKCYYGQISHALLPNKVALCLFLRMHDFFVVPGACMTSSMYLIPGHILHMKLSLVRHLCRHLKVHSTLFLCRHTACDDYLDHCTYLQCSLIKLYRSSSSVPITIIVLSVTSAQHRCLGVVMDFILSHSSSTGLYLNQNKPENEHSII